MAYTGYERSGGAALTRVQGFCRHLTGSGGTFSPTTPVTNTTVDNYLDDAYYLIVGELLRNGYGTAVTAVPALGVLEQIQALDAVCSIEFSMPVTDTGEPNDRYKSMAARRDRFIKEFIVTDGLEQLGASRTRHKSSQLEATGRSIDRKRTVYEDSDIVQPRFPRGFGQRRDVGSRTGSQTGGGLADPNL